MSSPLDRPDRPAAPDLGASELSTTDWRPSTPSDRPAQAAYAWPVGAGRHDAERVGVARLAATVGVAAIVAGVVLGGIVLDDAIAAPSAGTVVVGGPVTMTAAPGWILATSPSGATGSASGIELQKSDAILTAQVVASDYTGDSASVLSSQEQSLSGEAAQVSYGAVHTTSIGGHDTTYVTFEASVMSAHGPGIIDGELICMVVVSEAVVVMVGAPQGDLSSFIDEVSTMLASVRVGS